MNRRGFLSQLFVTTGGIIVSPSIVTHGLKLKPLKNNYGWTAEDVALYNKFPFYIANLASYQRTQFKNWAELINQSKWPPNMGSVIRCR